MDNNKILKIGKVLGTDANGFIINESKLNKIAAPWKEALEEITQEYKKNLGALIHSIYVRGTVARGQAIEGVSDIDTFAVILKNPDEIDNSWIKEVRKRLENKYIFATGVEIELINYDELLEGDEMFTDRFMIKVQSACLDGEDLADKITPFKADFETAKYFHGHLEKVLENAKKGIVNNSGPEDVEKWCRWVMKRIVRAGFVLVMDKEKVFTRDLYPAYELFSKHYVVQETQMREALEMAINPIADVDKLLAFLDDFGQWIKEEIEGKFFKS